MTDDQFDQLMRRLAEILSAVQNIAPANQGIPSVVKKRNAGPQIFPPWTGKLGNPPAEIE